MASRIVEVFTASICAAACSQQEATVPAPSAKPESTPHLKGSGSVTLLNNSDMRIRSHCSLFGYRVRLLAAFPERLGDRTLHMLDCRKPIGDCEAIVISLEHHPSQLDFSDVRLGSYRLSTQEPHRAIIEEVSPSHPVAKKTIILDTARGTATYDIVGRTHDNDWRAEVKCDEVLKAVPEQ